MSKNNDIITLLTDFGVNDGFVGTMKGVILSINPAAKIVDICHEVPAQDIEAGAFILNTSYHYFSAGTIHVVVVDPGVGSGRRILAAASDKYLFLAPDNRILKYIFHTNETLTVVEVLNKKLFGRHVSQTFQGRDVFAPVAAHLSTGITLEELGPIIKDYDRGQIDRPWVTNKKIIGKIIYVDRFGNLITNINLALLTRREIRLTIGTITINRLSNCYAEVDSGQPLAIAGSSGYLEIAVRNGNAQQQLYVKRGDMVELNCQ